MLAQAMRAARRTAAARVHAGDARAETVRVRDDAACGLDQLRADTKRGEIVQVV
jgi:hypothetical protein